MLRKQEKNTLKKHTTQTVGRVASWKWVPSSIVGFGGSTQFCFHPFLLLTIKDEIKKKGVQYKKDNK